jgi:hypothetical protein
MAKGFEGYIAVLPETKGWGTTTSSEGFFLYADSESLSIGQEFTDRPDKLVQGRAEKPASRTVSAQKPNGDIEFQMRSDDVLSVLMGHFQKYTGTTMFKTGTPANYTFVPEKKQPDWVGSSWGTGGYTSDSGDIYTFGILRKILDNSDGTDNSTLFSNCIVDQLVFNLEADNDAKITASIKSKSVDVGTHIGSSLNPPSSLGSYSSLSPFEGYEGTFSIGGRTDLDITSITFTSVNNTEDRSSLGDLNPTKYDFGRYMVTGVAQIDAPPEALAHLGSMASDLSLAINGTLWNGSNDYITISMPNCKYEPFDVNLSGASSTTEYGLAFKAFESADGATAPISVVVQTTGMGSAFTKL